MRVIITGGAGFLGQLVARAMLDRGDEVELVDVVAPPTALAAHPARLGRHGRCRSRRSRPSSPPTSSCTSPPSSRVPPSRTSTSACASTSTRRGPCSTGLGRGARVPSSCSRARSPCSAAIRSARRSTYHRRHPAPPAVELRHPEVHRRAARRRLHPRGAVRGRSLRLMTVAVRPGRPNAAASSFVSGIIREPLAGTRAVCPVDAATPIIVSSPLTPWPRSSPRRRWMTPPGAAARR